MQAGTTLHGTLRVCVHSLPARAQTTSSSPPPPRGPSPYPPLVSPPVVLVFALPSAWGIGLLVHSHIVASTQMWSSAQILAIRADGPPSFVDDYAETRITVYMGFLSFMIIIWEHIVTFSDEVDYIWFGKKGLVVMLFLINRYVTPLGFIINLFAYMSPSWTPERCQQFVRYEGSMTVIGLNVAGIMMLMRVAALYSGRPLVVLGTALVLAIEFSVNAWLLTHGEAVIHDRRIHACTMVFDTAVVGKWAAASAWLPLLYDTVVFILVVYRTVGPVRNKTAGKIANVLLRDGMLYYSVIFSINLVLTMMIAFAPQSIQNITAQTEYLLTVAMMSRITIHLRKQARSRDEDPFLVTWSLSTMSDYPSSRSRLRFNKSNATAQTFTDPRIAVTVEETVHDDHGNIVDDPAPKATEEWYEMQPSRSARLANSRSWESENAREPQLRFLV